MPKQIATRRKTLPKSPASKIDQIIVALRTPKGATIAQLVTLTGWQAHSVRGAMSGALKKKRGFTITSTKTGKERAYKIGGTR